MAASSAESPPALQVLVMHGLWQPAQVMWPLTAFLKHRGWEARSVAWSPTGRSLEENAAAVIEAHCQCRDTRYALVGHSMGGLLARMMMSADSTLPVDCIVTLDTPHQGARSAQLIHEQVPFGESLLGKAWQNALDGVLPPWRQVCPLGQIICKEGSFWISRFAPNSDLRQHGRAVSPDEAQLDGADTVCVDTDHTTMLINRSVFNQCDHYLRHHRFDSNHSSTTASE
ncbi:alpha/beta fold hydrolase [Gammaproteobacteria bacterium]|nr:alpha/beta fold hydrolase [Gammaproteobacteria bacterium]